MDGWMDGYINKIISLIIIHESSFAVNTQCLICTNSAIFSNLCIIQEKVLYRI